MTYLYGDSSPSALDSNFIEFLQDALDCSVSLLQADVRLREGAEREVALKTAHEAEKKRLEELSVAVAHAVEAAALGAKDSSTAACAEGIVRAAAALVREAGERAQSALTAEVARLETQTKAERANCAKALEKLMVRHDLPQMSLDLHLVQQPGATYGAKLAAKSDFGLEAVLELSVPPSHAMGQVLRVDKLVERLEISAPESGGWLRKEVKPRPHRIDKDYVTELFIGAGSTTIKLRADQSGAGAGFDLLIRGTPPRVQLQRVGEGELPLFDLAEADADRVLELQHKLVLSCAQLVRSRSALLDAKLDGIRLQDLTTPKLIVERLIAVMAPIVQDIARHSLTPRELVLKRTVGDGRREEIFVAREQLSNKLAVLPEALQTLFAPLGLQVKAAKPAVLATKDSLLAIEELSPEDVFAEKTEPGRVDSARVAPQAAVSVASTPPRELPTPPPRSSPAKPPQ